MSGDWELSVFLVVLTLSIFAHCNGPKFMEHRERVLRIEHGCKP